MTKDGNDKTWWFTDEEGNIIFSVTIEWREGTTIPEKLVELIELYSKGYRVKDD